MLAKHFVIVAATALTLAAVTNSPASALNPLASPVNSSGLIAYYDMNEGTGDVARNRVGADKHMQIVGADWTRGRYSKGLAFVGTDGLPPGSSDYVRAEGPFVFGQNEATIATWFRYNEMDGHWHAVISSPECCNYRVLLYPDGRLYVNAGQHYDWLVDGVVLQPNTWYHIALTMRGGDAARLYIDGRLVGTNVDAVPAQLPDASAFVLGTGEWDTGFYYGLNGKLDGTRIYCRALSQSEVRTAMRPGAQASQGTSADEANDD